MVKRAEAAGCPVLVFTVDQISGTNRETLRRFERQDTRDCRVCHDRTSLQTRSVRRPMFSGLDLAGVAYAAARDLGLCQATQGYDLDAPRDQGHRHARGRGRSPSPTAPTRSSVRTTAGAPRRLDDRRSRASRKCWKAPRGAFPSSSTAVSGVARTSSRPSRLAPRPSAWGDRMSGAWRHSARKASKPSSTSSRGNSSWPCDTREPPRFRTSRGRTSSSGSERTRRLRQGLRGASRLMTARLMACRVTRRGLLVEDLTGDLFIGTGRGVDRFDPARDRFTHYSADDVVPRGEI